MSILGCHSMMGKAVECVCWMDVDPAVGEVEDTVPVEVMAWWVVGIVLPRYRQTERRRAYSCPLEAVE